MVGAGAGFGGIESLGLTVRATGVEGGSRLELPSVVVAVDKLFPAPGERVDRTGQARRGFDDNLRSPKRGADLRIARGLARESRRQTEYTCRNYIYILYHNLIPFFTSRLTTLNIWIREPLIQSDLDRIMESRII